MKFDSYLIKEGMMGRKYTEPRTISIEYEKALNIINQNCMKSFKAVFNKKRIYRGMMNSYGDFAVSDPTKGVRKAANMSNHFMLLIDNLDSWKKYPKRSKSLVCTTSKYDAKSYGNIYLVLPYDHAKIGTCNANDFWFSFDVLSDVYYFTNNLIELLDYTGISHGEEPKNWNELKKWLNELNSKRIEIKENILDTLGRMDGLLVRWINNPKNINIIEYLNNMLDPKKNNFNLVSPGYKYNKKTEVWVGMAPSLLINVPYDDEKEEEIIKIIKRDL